MSINDLSDEADFRGALLELESSFAGPFSFEEGGDRIDFSRLFAGQVDLASLLPASKKDKLTTDQFDDPTMGGLLSDWTQPRVADEIEEAELLWDERAMVFWRFEHVKDDLDPAAIWSKQSVFLRLLGDGSDEVLYSVHAKDLVTGLGLDATINSGLWLQKSKVCISITGIAGPSGGTKKKPVGLVYIGIKSGKKILVSKNQFKNKGRSSIQKATVKKALNLIIKQL